MSKVDKSIRKTMVSVFIVTLIITGIFFVMMFGPSPKMPVGFFPATISYYTRGTEKLFFEDYAQFIVQNLREVGIDADIYPMEYAVFLSKVIKDKDFQLALLRIEEEEVPHLEYFLKENATLNIFNFKDELDGGYTTSLIEKIKKEMNFQFRQSLFYMLDQHIVNNTLPFVPLFTPAKTYVYWDNLKGYDPKWGISHSLPYMYFEGTHTRQTSTDVLRIGIGNWQSINPFNLKTDGEKLLASLIMDKLIVINPEREVTRYGLINSWKYLNQTSIVLNIRSGATWQPPYDKTFGTYPFTSNDLVFTINQLKNPEINNKYSMYEWIKSVKVLNDTAILLNIDANPSTQNPEPYAFVLEDLSVYPLPYHYLHKDENNTSIDINKWQEYVKYPFGTGKYMINFDKTVLGGQVTLERFDKWNGIGVMPNKPQKEMFTEIITKVYSDTYSMMLELQQGENIDIGDFGEDPAVIDSINEEHLSYAFVTNNALIILAFNLNDPIVGGENNYLNSTKEGISVGLAIRKAIAYAINKAAINIALHKGKYNITDCPIPYFHKQYYYTEVVKYDYSVSNALKYLEIAGFNVTGALTETLRTEITIEPLIVTTVGISILVYVTKRTKRVRS